MYTIIPKEVKLELARLNKEEYDFEKCITNPSYFAKHVLGITPFSYQHLILRKFADAYKGANGRIIFCTSRQIGKSVMVAIIALWYASYNKANNSQGTGIHKNTKVGIISKSEDQAKKLMREIQNLYHSAEEEYKKITRPIEKTPYNKKEIHFRKGWIKCFAPTGACRGESFDILIIDEAGFVPEEEFRDAMEPTVSATGGKIILTSTPNGQSGFFFELFDPYNTLDTHEYEKFWFNWKFCENPIQLKMIEQKLKFAQETGNMKSFDQEYNALFTADQMAFFESKDVDKGADDTIVEHYEWHDTPCNIGIDYGGVGSQTSITVVTKIGNEIRLLWQFAKKGFDENLLMDPMWEHSIPNLMNRYSVETIVVDSCAQGTRTNTQLQNEGYPVFLFDFRTDRVAGERNRGYYMFRAALKRGIIRYPVLKNLISELKSVQETKTDGGKNTRIKAPKNYPCDRSDGLMMASYPFLKDDGSFGSTTIDYDKVIQKIQSEELNPRHDKQWVELNNNIYDFLLKKTNGGSTPETVEEKENEKPKTGWESTNRNYWRKKFSGDSGTKNW